MYFNVFSCIKSMNPKKNADEQVTGTESVNFDQLKYASF
jgi:hypothetical protein